MRILSSRTQRHRTYSYSMYFNKSKQGLYVSLSPKHKISISCPLTFIIMIYFSKIVMYFKCARICLAIYFFYPCFQILKFSILGLEQECSIEHSEQSFVLPLSVSNAGDNFKLSRSKSKSKVKRTWSDSILLAMPPNNQTF